MDPRITDLQTIASLCAGLLIAVGLVLRYGPTEPECDPNCERCQLHRQSQARNRAYARCPMCFRNHPPSERCP